MTKGSDDIVLTDEAIEEALSAADFLETCDLAFRLYGSGELINPPREQTVGRDGDVDFFRLEMPAEWTGRYRGRKLIEERSDVGTGRLGARSATIEIEELKSGRRATVAAEAITNWRTGAAAVLGARYLGKDEIRVAGVVGTGRIAEAIVRCIDEGLGCEQIRVTSRSESRRETFANRLSGELSTTVVAVASVDEVADGVDALFAAVPTPTPVIFDRHLGSNTHLSVIGGDPRSTQVDSGVIKSRHIVPDHVDQARVSGDFVGMPEGLEDGALTMGDAALGRLSDRKGTGSLCYLTGLAAQDLVTAAVVLERSVWVD
jgi:ornithine cyclodeaminase/alanine dehydrogenase-like protein (mu-crystallin family)